MSRLKVVAFASAAVACLLGLEAVAATNAYFVPSSEATEPYQWNTEGNWFSDSAGATALGRLPGDSDKVNLSAEILVGKSVSILGPMIADLYSFSASKCLDFTIEDGATLMTGHTSAISGGTVLRVKDGGVLFPNSIFRVDCSSDNSRDTKILIEEGGVFRTTGNTCYLGYGKNGRGVLENHGYVCLSNTLDVASRGSSSSTAVGLIDNHATLETADRGSTYVRLGAYAGASGYLTNNVGATATFEMSLVVGGSSNATGTVVNRGLLGTTKYLFIGGDNLSSSNSTSSKRPTGYFYNLANATNVFTGELRFGGWKYGRGTYDNRGVATFGGVSYLGYYDSSTEGTFNNHSTGTINFNKTIHIGYKGKGTLSNAGKIVLDDSAIVNVGCRSGATGTFDNNNSARFYGDRSGINVATVNGATGTVKLRNNARMERSGAITMSAGEKGKATFEMSDNAVLTAPGVMVIGVGRYDDTTDPWTGYANFTLSGNACITNLNDHLYVASNRYGKALLELAGNSRIVHSNARGRTIYVGNNLLASTNSHAELRLRGGEIVMATNSTLLVGRNSTSNPGCNGFLSGWGRFSRHCPELTGSGPGMNLAMFCGAITADGEGEEHDLDLSVFRKVNDSAKGKNHSGTNGWYAINKGRLYYPCRNSDYVNLGDYYDSEDAPSYVNGVKFAFTDRSGNLHGQLYATDRDDIPAGLPEDDDANGVRRLGVWRAGLCSSYFSEKFGTDKATRGTFTSATATIRYDNFRLNGLKDGEGAFPADQRVCLYRHTGSCWVRVASVDAATAETDGYRISGTLVPVDNDWNLGFFAVVAEPKRGLAVLVR